jgi:hypothetical protein
MAQGLVQQDCTAVVAMQFPISDGAATTFTGEFYGALADGFPVDQAATSARKALIAEYAAEWATPVLFLRAPDGRVFDHIVAQPELTAVPTEPPSVEAEDEARAREALATDAETTETVRKSPDTPLPAPVAVVPTPVRPEKPVEPETPVQTMKIIQPETTAQPVKRAEPAPEEAVRGAAAAAAATQSVTPSPPIPQATRPTTQPVTQQAPVYQQQAPVYGQQAPAYGQQQPPTYQQPQQQAYPSQPGPPPPRYVNPPPTKRRWGLIITIVLAVVAIGFGALAWYGSTLPQKVDTNGGGGGGGQGSTLSGPRISAAHLTTGLTINGDASDWPDNTPTFDSNALVFGNESGLTGHWGLAYDDANLYFVVAVTDPTNVQTHGNDTSQLFKGDGVSFEFGTAVPKNNNASLESGDKHVLLGPAGGDGDEVISGINVPNGAVFTRGTNTIQGLKAAVARSDEGYVMEAAIPWSTLGVDSVGAGAEFGMNLNVSDSIASGAKAGELNAMVSNNPERRGNDAKFRSIWGTLTLSS